MKCTDIIQRLRHPDIDCAEFIRNLADEAANEIERLMEDKMNGLEMKYFVLKPRGGDAYAHASRAAMSAYARAIEMENPILAEELIIWVTREITNQQKSKNQKS